MCMTLSLCESCGAEFSFIRADARFCSDDCRSRAWKIANPERARAIDRCRDRAGYRPPSRQKMCVCGERFSPTHYRYTRCERCRRPLPVLANVTRGRGHQPLMVLDPRTFVAGTCGECGDAFTVESPRQPHLYCSPKCRDRANRRADHQRRRTHIRGGERIFAREIFDRDGWMCRLCGEGIERDEIVPHPLAATLDHIIPLALGGLHRMDNVQAAHFLCNSRKGAGTLC